MCAAACCAKHGRGADRAALDAMSAAARALMAEGTLDPHWQCLEIFRPVHSAKSRRDCVLLPFEALKRAASAGL